MNTVLIRFFATFCCLTLTVSCAAQNTKSNNNITLDNKSAIKSYAQTEKGQAFIRSQAGKDYSEKELTAIFQQVYRDDNILKKIDRPAEKSKPWYQYEKIFSDAARIKNGVDFYNNNKDVLQQAYATYGVDPEIIVAIIGVETRYGKVMGNDKVITSLSTISFDYPAREKFFTKELIAFLKMAKQDNLDLFAIKGSYAGAMGMTQFMPSSFLAYAVDYEKNNKIDLWTNPHDAIFSVANYLAQNGWQKDGHIVDEAYITKNYSGELNHKPFTTLGGLASQGVFLKNIHDLDKTKVGIMSLEGETAPLFYITFNNFAVITKYNTSKMYALAVFELAQKIVAKR